MQLTASMVALAHLNANTSEANESPKFIANGRQRLIDESVSVGQKLDQLLELSAVKGLIDQGDFDHFLGASIIVAQKLGECFEHMGPSTTARAAIYFLSQNGYRLKPDRTRKGLFDDPCWDLPLNSTSDSQALADRLRDYFFHPTKPSSFVTSRKLRRLVDLADGFINEADHIPFGSLASAIGRVLDISITLWPMRADNPKISGTRAIRYTYSSADKIEEIIIYHPSIDGPSTLDFVARYTVAHELAHVALRHEPGDGVSRQLEEIEAHCLAAVFMAKHGAPTVRTAPSNNELRELLNSTDLGQTEKDALIQQLAEILNESGSCVGKSVVVSEATGEEASVFVPEVTGVVDQFVFDEAFRSTEIAGFRTAMDAVLGS